MAEEKLERIRPVHLVARESWIVEGGLPTPITIVEVPSGANETELRRLREDGQWLYGWPEGAQPKLREVLNDHGLLPFIKGGMRGRSPYDQDGWWCWDCGNTGMGPYAGEWDSTTEEQDEQCHCCGEYGASSHEAYMPMPPCYGRELVADYLEHHANIGTDDDPFWVNRTIYEFTGELLNP